MSKRKRNVTDEMSKSITDYVIKRDFANCPLPMEQSTHAAEVLFPKYNEGISLISQMNTYLISYARNITTNKANSLSSRAKTACQILVSVSARHHHAFNIWFQFPLICICIYVYVYVIPHTSEFPGWWRESMRSITTINPYASLSIPTHPIDLYQL